MSLAQIETFVTVADTRSVTSAASRLRIAQPALSRQIHKLEDEVGAVLFFRTSRGMELSPAGQRFLVHARAILGEVSAAVAAVRG